MRDRAVAVTVGVLSALFGGLMTEGGLREVVVYAPRGELGPVAVGGLGLVASALLVVGGVGFVTRRPFARRLSRVGALGAIPAHLLGFGLGFVGWVGLILGVIYPAVLLLLFRARPSLGGAGTELGVDPGGEHGGQSRDGSPHDVTSSHRVLAPAR